mmetsp:Transcript_136950/g.438143  ORF Transcript_136950/g.438143 Transcript_136950/m.438143 type:complete len:157 (-) Transcript_136950:221-691(-)
MDDLETAITLSETTRRDEDGTGQDEGTAATADAGSGDAALDSDVGVQTFCCNLADRDWEDGRRFWGLQRSHVGHIAWSCNMRSGSENDIGVCRQCKQQFSGHGEKNTTRTLQKWVSRQRWELVQMTPSQYSIQKPNALRRWLLQHMWLQQLQQTEN